MEKFLKFAKVLDEKNSKNFCSNFFQTKSLKFPPFEKFLLTPLLRTISGGYLEVLKVQGQQNYFEQEGCISTATRLETMYPAMYFLSLEIGNFMNHPRQTVANSEQTKSVFTIIKIVLLLFEVHSHISNDIPKIAQSPLPPYWYEDSLKIGFVQLLDMNFKEKEV